MIHNNKLLDEILMDEECGGRCLASQVFKHIPLGDDMLLQLKMVEKFKYIWSNDEQYDIGFDTALQRFSQEHAKNYRDLWNAGEKYHHVEAMFWELMNYNTNI